MKKQKRSGSTEGLWRLLDRDYRDQYKNVAVDEAVSIAVENCTSPNTIRFWRNKNAVVIGRSQNPEQEINLDACKRYKVQVIRRFTGGGAVYHDLGNLNWTVVVGRDHKLSKVKGILDIFQIFSKPIVEGTKRLGINTEFRSPNSIFVRDKKVSGMAAYVKRRSILCHGTLLVNTDVDALTRIYRQLKAEVTTIQGELGRKILMSSVKRLILDCFYSMYNVKVRRGTLSDLEKVSLTSLTEKYVNT